MSSAAAVTRLSGDVGWGRSTDGCPGAVASVISTAFTPPAGPTIAASAVGYTVGAIAQVGTATYTANNPPDVTATSPAVTATGITGDNSATWTPTINVVVPGGIGVRLLDAPAATAEDPRAGLYIIDHLAPGTVIERRIEVTNTTAAPAAIKMYAAAASIDDGAFVGDAGDSPNELSTWNAVRPNTLDLDAGGRANVTVTIAVPSDAASGERYAVVWAEVRSGAAPVSGVEQVNRVGLRQYLSVGPGGPPAADFTVDSLTASRSADGGPLVLATVHNTGGRALDMVGELELLDGPGGLRAGPFPASLGSTLAIGESGQVVIPLDEQVPDGPWEAAITLRSGLLERNAQATSPSRTPVRRAPCRSRPQRTSGPSSSWPERSSSCSVRPSCGPSPGDAATPHRTTIPPGPARRDDRACRP